MWVKYQLLEDAEALGAIVMEQDAKAYAREYQVSPGWRRCQVPSAQSLEQQGKNRPTPACQDQEEHLSAGCVPLAPSTGRA